MNVPGARQRQFDVDDDDDDDDDDDGGGGGDIGD